jgi:ring-1,2-phenylacetyl-CoA epoxidase subunit PaaC
MAGLSPAIAAPLALGDDALVLGQRLGEWCGHAPTLELDLALANIGLDLIGQAQHFLALAAEREGQGRDADKLAFRRDGFDFTNCLLVEQPNGDFAQTIARQFLFSAWQELAFAELASGDDAAVAAVARKALKEIAYHARFASEWVVRLGDGTEESRERMTDGLAWMWRFSGELFDGGERGLGVDLAGLRPAWDLRIDAALDEAGLARPADQRPVTGGRRGRHTEHLGHLLSDMQFLQRAYPDAVW